MLSTLNSSNTYVHTQRLKTALKIGRLVDSKSHVPDDVLYSAQWVVLMHQYKTTVLTQCRIDINIYIYIYIYIYN